MINPTWQDKDRRVIYIPPEYLRLKDPIKYWDGKKWLLLVWNEKKVTIEIDGLSIDCDRKNLFLADGEADFDEYKRLNETK